MVFKKGLMSLKSKTQQYQKDFYVKKKSFLLDRKFITVNQ